MKYVYIFGGSFPAVPLFLVDGVALCEKRLSENTERGLRYFSGEVFNYAGKVS